MTPLKANTLISFILLFVLLVLPDEAMSQRRRNRGVEGGVETFNPPAALNADSLTTDSVRTDSVVAKPIKKQPLDAPVIYSANDSIVFEEGSSLWRWEGKLSEGRVGSTNYHHEYGQ